MADKAVSTRLMRGAMWLGAARLFVNSIGFVSTLILARLLVPDDFGLVALSSTLSALINALTAVPVAQALVRQDHVDRQDMDTAWTLNLLRGCGVFLLISAFAWPFSNIYDDPRLMIILPVTGLGALLTGLENPSLVTFSRDLVFWQKFVLQSSAKVVGFAVSFSIAIIFQSYWALILGGLASNAMHLLVGYLVKPYWPRPSFARVRQIWAFSSWLGLSHILNTLSWRADALILGLDLPKREVGLYKVASDLAILPTRELLGPISSTLFPGFSSARRSGSDMVSAFNRTQSLMAFVGLPIGIGFVLVADRFVPLVLGEKWLAIIPIIQVIGIPLALNSIVSGAPGFALSQGLPKALLFRDAAIFAIRLPALIIGLLLGGLWGFVWARVGAWAFGFVLNLNLVYRVVGHSSLRQLHNVWRSLASVSAMAATVLLVKQAMPVAPSIGGQVGQFFALVMFGALAYVLVHLILWAMLAKPDGPERFMLDLASKASARLRQKRAART
ncbi:MAG: oligosaccharide flippase family protein [Rhodothalassiaceae bacterium]